MYLARTLGVGLGARSVRWLQRGGLALSLLVLAACTSLQSTKPPEPVSSPTAERRELRLGLALGGGAVRGFAHVGVIQVLEEAGLRPSHLAGTSAGSLVAAFYASGKTPAELVRVAETMQEGEITDWMLPILNRGALRGQALARYVNGQVGNKTLEQMAIPLGIVATDLGSGRAITFRRGNTGEAVRASSAVPAVFQPVRIGEREYVDGGLVSPVPVRQTREMGANFVIAVDISSDPEGNPFGDTFQILMQTFAIMGQSINALALKEADLVVRPALTGVKSADFSARLRAIEAGRAAMRASLPALMARLAQFEEGR
ncbi:patatin-like phospholipase family protein [Limnohabitans sp.]|jgi:NTE family protein|uniref:patatin-like phospholipase family protein n=1 Tax=Limnohabitans sp. TaxID=1907725 RepID=UPI0037C048BB